MAHAARVYLGVETNIGAGGGSMKMRLLCEYHAQRRPFLTSRSNLVRLSLVLSRALRSGCRVTRAFGSSRETPCVPASATNKMIGMVLVLVLVIILVLLCIICRTSGLALPASNRRLTLTSAKSWHRIRMQEEERGSGKGARVSRNDEAGVGPFFRWQIVDQ